MHLARSVRSHPRLTRALALAAIHIMLAIPQAMIGFYLYGEGYVALAAALYLSHLTPYRRLVCWHGPDHHPLHADRPPYYTTIGYVDKAIEAVLRAMKSEHTNRATKKGLHRRRDAEADLIKDHQQEIDKFYKTSPMWDPNFYI